MPERDTGSDESIVALAGSALAQGRQALAAGDGAEAMRWLERAHRLVPADPNATLTLASACLPQDPQRALALFSAIAERHDVSQAWLGVATAQLRCGSPVAAAHALANALSRHTLTPQLAALADLLAIPSGFPGWCALTSSGSLEIRAPDVARITLDGRELRGTRLPETWQTARRIEVTVNGTPILGSPIRIDAIRAIAGCVEPREGGITGWAWHPRDPATHPVLTLRDAAGRDIRTWQADDEAISVKDTGALARPRAIHVPPDWLAEADGPFRVLGPDGRELLGSPLLPRADQVAHIAAARGIAAVYPAAAQRLAPPDPIAAAVLRADAIPPARPIGADKRRREPTIVIPVHDGGASVQDCLDCVLETLTAEARVLVVDDGSSDPAMIDLLDALARRGAITLLRHNTARGFPASANAGILAAKGRDVVLLNSDTLPPPRWIERLRDAAYAAADIGTVTPLSNDASILSYPGAAGTNPRPDRHGVISLDRMAARANADATVDIPVGIGFCLYIRRDCLNATGLLRADLFAQGYGEETDFCLRARHLGWRHVALPGLFVGHQSGQSFGTAATHLRARNTRIIEQLHPGYQALIDRFLADDPLAESRRRIDTVIWRRQARNWHGAVILITHKDGGGVEQRVRESAKAHAAARRRPVILRPARVAGGGQAITVRDGIDDNTPNLIFRMPDELPALRRFLRACRPERQEVHHLLGHHATIYDLIGNLGVPWVVHVHDYAWFCPRVVLVNGHGRYCGEPDVAECEACVADHGHHLHEHVPVATLRNRSTAVLRAAARVITPSDDTGSRIRRHFPGLTTETIPHDDDTIASATPATPTTSRARSLICVVGGISIPKGYDVLLACARDAQRRDLDLGFVVIGYTLDDERIMATGRVFVTGLYKPHEAVGLIKEQRSDLGFIPSVCPETWCLSLDDIWRAGLRAVAFDIGAPAERIRRTGRGFLLPLGLSIGAINNSLIAAIRAARH